MRPLLNVGPLSRSDRCAARPVRPQGCPASQHLSEVEQRKAGRTNNTTYRFATRPCRPNWTKSHEVLRHKGLLRRLGPLLVPAFPRMCWIPCNASYQLFGWSFKPKISLAQHKMTPVFGFALYGQNGCPKRTTALWAPGASWPPSPAGPAATRTPWGGVPCMQFPRRTWTNHRVVWSCGKAGEGKSLLFWGSISSGEHSGTIEGSSHCLALSPSMEL